MNRRHLRHAQAVLSVTVLLVGLAASPVTAATAPTPEEPKQVAPGTAPTEAPPAGFSSWEELSDTQERLNGAADQILSVSSPGYAGLVAAPETRELTVYWKGAVPTDVQDRAKQTGVPVKFVSARFSAAELAEEVARLGADTRVFTAGPNVDGSGTTATVGSDADAAAVRATARLPLSVSVDRKPSLLYDRQNDISPYWGGARWDNLTWGSYCSTGFSVNWFGQQKMLTAAHCGDVGNRARVGNPTQPLTSISMDVNPRDTQFLDRPAGRSFDGRIYNGGIYSNSSLKVIGPQSDYVGNLICTDGARTGEHCNARVTAVNTTVLGITPLTFAVSGVGNCIAAPGDSGGPVFSYGYRIISPWPVLQFGAWARGTITAGYMDTPCIADSGSRVPPPVLITGSYRVYYAPVLRPFGDPHVGSQQFYGYTLM